MPLSDELARQMIGKLTDQARKTADHGPGGAQWFRPEPARQHRPAFVMRLPADTLDGHRFARREVAHAGEKP
ncbi:MAG: hypothetical protein BIFFINMI_00894 [Phycisphaerae bacterium]|nr:hypothetical protein [Phycisphaerae bacterium]